MQLTKPLPFDEAVAKLGSRTLIGSALTSDEWSDIPVALRERAFFSSQVESLRFLQRARDGIADFLQSNREDLPDGQSALKTGSRADFVKQMQDFLGAEGVDRTTGGLTDITSQRRLGLIFDTQVRQANDYGYWKQGMDPDTLDAFPAQRFIRVIDVKDPRDAHTEFEDQVYLKTDPIWADVINDDFNVPWGPWGWGCGHDVEDVDRAEAESLGLLGPSDVPSPDTQNFNDNLQASAQGLAPDLLAKLKTELGDQLIIDGDALKWSTGTAPAPAPATPAAPPSPPRSGRGQGEVSIPPATPLQAALQTAETELAARKGTEKLIGLDAQGKVVLQKTGGKSHVSLTAQDVAKMKDTVLTHNHPVGVSFSHADIQTAAAADVAELRAVGVQLRYTYSLKRPAAGWPAAMEQRHSAIQKQVLTELSQKVQSGTTDLQTAEREVAHETMTRLAKELNLTYERTQRT